MSSLHRTTTVIVGVSAMVIVGVGLVLAFAPQSLFGTSSDSSSTVAQIYGSHLQRIESLNTTAVMQEYTNNATVTWKGVAGGYAGTYAPAQNISALYKSLLPHFSQLNITNIVDSVTVNGSCALVTGSFRISGLFPPSFSGCASGGNFDGTVNIEVELIRTGNAWLISSEIWDFVYPFSSGVCT